MGFLLRVALLAAAIWLLWRLWTKLRPMLGSGPTAEPPAPPQFEPMARCSQCGTHLPAKALAPDGRCGRCAALP